MNWSEHSSLPDGWQLSTLGDVAEVVGGGTPPTSDPANFSEVSGHPWVTPADLTGYTEKYISRGRRFLTQQGLKKCSARYVPAGTVLYSTRAPIGYVAIASESLTTNQGFRSLVPSEVIDSNYLYHVLKYLTPLARERASGTIFAEISGGALALLPIAYPSLEDQRRIAQTLDAVELEARRGRNHLAEAQANLSSFSQALISSACIGNLTQDLAVQQRHQTQPVEKRLALLAKVKRAGRGRRPAAAVNLPLPDLPSGFATATIGDVAVQIDYGTSQRAEATAFDGSIPVLRMGNIQNGKLDLSSLKYCRVDNEVSKKILHPGDLLFNRTNSAELVGKTAVFREQTEMSFASYLIRVRLDEEIVEPEFVAYWINSAWGRAWAQLVKSDGVSQSNINSSKLAAMPLPIPALAEQKEIINRVSRLLQLRAEVGQALAIAEENVRLASVAALEELMHGSAEPSLPRSPRQIPRQGGRALPIAVPDSTDEGQRRAVRAEQAREGAASKKATDAQSVPADAPLTHIVRSIAGGAAVKALWERSDLPVDAFYSQLRREIDEGLLREVTDSQPRTIIEAEA
ncbi:restriction endonuclease subunit S [Micromonospora sp. WMMD736]|uniref:restriction endonuclease subunit S n=1 Tax=Micromonospora sp. WMMD736 TaxID=3404112 RepID=UPI003B95BA4E